MARFHPITIVLTLTMAAATFAAPQAQTPSAEFDLQQSPPSKQVPQSVGDEMSIIHELMMNHDRIRRSVTNLPDGIRTVTESDDPALARTIQDHVAQADARVAAASDPGLPMESDALRTIIRNGRTVTTTIERTPKGAIVVQTSTDAETVRALQQHASEVTALVERGMAAMHDAMMKERGASMMGGRGMMMQHSAQAGADASMKQHGDMAMGFDQDKATHHFTLTEQGGLIAVSANDASDHATRDAIQAHLREIAASFARGDFEKPLMTHGEVPPGVSGMQRHKAEITYTYEGNERGGLVRIATANVDAQNAIHDFLRYQIKAHATGDRTDIEK